MNISTAGNHSQRLQELVKLLQAVFPGARIEAAAGHFFRTDAKQAKP